MSVEPFQVCVLGDVPVVSAPDEVDIGNAAKLRAALLTVADHPVVVVDLSATEFCDSSGLNVLVRALRRAQTAGGEVRLVVTTDSVLRILAVSGVGSIFPTYSSLADAIADGPNSVPAP